MCLYLYNVLYLVYFPKYGGRMKINKYVLYENRTVLYENRSVLYESAACFMRMPSSR